MSAFIRSKNDYDACVQLIESEYKAQIHAHWTEYSLFRQKYGRCSHRYVVDELKKQVTYCKPMELKDDEEYTPPSFISRGLFHGSSCVEDKLMATAERQQVVQSLQNLRVLNNRRTEECRGFGKFLDATQRAVAAITLCDVVDCPREEAVRYCKRRSWTVDIPAAQWQQLAAVFSLEVWPFRNRDM